ENTSIQVIPFVRSNASNWGLCTLSFCLNSGEQSRSGLNPSLPLSFAQSVRPSWWDSESTSKAVIARPLYPPQRLHTPPRPPERLSAKHQLVRRPKPAQSPAHRKAWFSAL